MSLAAFTRQWDKSAYTDFVSGLGGKSAKDMLRETQVLLSQAAAVSSLCRAAVTWAAQNDVDFVLNAEDTDGYGYYRVGEGVVVLSGCIGDADLPDRVNTITHEIHHAYMDRRGIEVHWEDNYYEECAKTFLLEATATGVGSAAESQARGSREGLKKTFRRAFHGWFDSEEPQDRGIEIACDYLTRFGYPIEGVSESVANGYTAGRQDALTHSRIVDITPVAQENDEDELPRIAVADFAGHIRPLFNKSVSLRDTVGDKMAAAAIKPENVLGFYVYKEPLKIVQRIMRLDGMTP